VLNCNTLIWMRNILIKEKAEINKKYLHVRKYDKLFHLGTYCSTSLDSIILA